VFEGNRPCRWDPELAEAAIAREQPSLAAGVGDESAPALATHMPPRTLRGLLGEAVDIGPPASVELPRQPGRNVLLVAPPESIQGLLASIVTGAVASARQQGEQLELHLFDGHTGGPASLAPWLTTAGLTATVTKPRESEPQMAMIAQRIQQRVAEDRGDEPPLLLVIDPLNRFSDLRNDDAFSFSLDAAAAGPSGSAALQAVLRDGPAVGVFTILCSPSAETVARWLPRQSRHDLQQRILGRVNAADSATLIDSSEAAGMSAATMLIYDDADGSVRKFRTCNLPAAEAVRDWLAGL